MDLLCEPENSGEQHELPPRTPYVCDEEWDGGQFCSYPVRKGKVRWIPERLRPLLGGEGIFDNEPYLETLYPTPGAETQSFIQTWLFFGLISEFIALNEVTTGSRLVTPESAIVEIKRLHETLSVRDDSGQRHIAGLPVLQLGPLMRERIGPAGEMTERFLYLRACLYLTNQYLLSVQDLDETIRLSIAAVGELFTTGLFAASQRVSPQIELPVIGFSWNSRYIRTGGRVEQKMLQHGWCPSEIEKIKYQFQGLQTMHYISQLQRAKVNVAHDSCSTTACSTFQLDIKTYRPLHREPDCPCDLIGIDDSMSDTILRSTNSYPILRIEGLDEGGDSFRLDVEPYEPGLPYVALSHVWANGLGNPTENSLPKCQLQHVARLIASLQSQIEPDSPEGPQPYRLWVDTLCCPVELGGKMIALERIADVYRNAAHVLVLDTSLTEFKAQDTNPAELLLRIFGSSPWTRRLWTLQEGALTKSLFIQFSDQAVNTFALLTQLFISGSQDNRYLRIWQDVMNSYNELQGFFIGQNQPIAHQLPIVNLQRALHFRTVSVLSDEALCISTLMSLDTGYIAAVQDGQQRMARMWELLARSKGGLSPRVLFFVDESLDIPGWRWAPRSLLGSYVKDSVMGIDERVMRFASTQNHVPGIPTALGLKVRLSGSRLMPTPRLPGMPLHPWEGSIRPREDQVILREKITKKWFRIIDWYRSRKLPAWTDEERFNFDDDANNPICREIDAGNCALIYDQDSNLEEIQACCLVAIKDTDIQKLQDTKEDVDLEEGIVVRRLRTVILSPLNLEESKMMDVFQELANQVATDSATADLLNSSHLDQEPRALAMTRVKERMKLAVVEARTAQPELMQIINNYVGAGLEDYMWAMIPKWFSHDTEMDHYQGQQVWFVD